MFKRSFMEIEPEISFCSLQHATPFSQTLFPASRTRPLLFIVKTVRISFIHIILLSVFLNYQILEGKTRLKVAATAAGAEGDLS
jgi:hypothetical protein